MNWSVRGVREQRRCELPADVGGGLGHHLEAVLKAVPGARGVLLERSASFALVEERSWANSFAKRACGQVGLGCAGQLYEPVRFTAVFSKVHRAASSPPFHPRDLVPVVMLGARK